MGLVFNLDPLLDRLNATRRRQGRADLTWAEIAPLLGMSRQALQNLARNRELRATNSRFIEAICRFFRCRPDQLLVLAPAVGGEPIDQDQVDRLVALRRELEPAELPPYHADVLYGEEASARWPRDRAGVTEAGPRLIRRSGHALPPSISRPQAGEPLRRLADPRGGRW